jgi:hypothetical protein
MADKGWVIKIWHRKGTHIFYGREGKTIISNGGEGICSKKNEKCVIG